MTIRAFQLFKLCFLALTIFAASGCGSDDTVIPPIEENEGTLSPLAGTILVNDTIVLTPQELRTGGATGPAQGVVTWVSSDPSIAFVDSGGEVRGLSAGTATITATWGDFVATQVVTVSGASVSSLTISATQITVALNTPISLNAVAMLSTGSTATVTDQVQWFPGNDAVSVSGSQVSLSRVGTYTLVGFYKGVVSNTLSITGSMDAVTLTNLSVTPNNQTLEIGDILQLTANGNYSDGSQLSVTNQAAWLSSDSAVVSVSSQGVVTAVGAGSTSIIASLSGMNASVNVTVEDDVPPVISGVTYYIKVPTSWPGLNVYAWKDNADLWEAWPGREITAKQGDWYVVQFDTADFDTATSSPNFVPNYAGSNDALKTTDITTRETTGFLVIDDDQSFEWFDSDPDELQLAVNPPGYVFTDELVNVTLSISGNTPVTGKYTLDGSDPETNGMVFNDGAIITIGQSLPVGSTVTLRVHATNGSAELTQQETYRRDEQVIVDAGNFSHLRIYQVMVEAWQDGDNNHNMGQAWGPSHHNGDIRGIINSLDYIKSLNMNAIWLTPIFQTSSGNAKLEGTGYYISDYFKIDSRFGTWDDAKELVETAHEKGIYVFFDGVFGHHSTTQAPATSPNGNNTDSSGQVAQYPGSLEFYKEVAAFWIDELGIDGWRLDVANEVPLQYWDDIRGSAEAACERRKNAGEDWGTLCYMVAEMISGEEEITENIYGPEGMPGLYSAFHFPGRYGIIWAYAAEEAGGRPDWPDANTFAKRLAWTYRADMKYPTHAQSNLFISNHDFVRLGDLIQRAGYGGQENPSYWARYKGAYTFFATFTGPVTMFYNEEIGAEVANFVDEPVECWTQDKCDDHVSRISGRTGGFNNNENDLKDYITTLMGLRDAHPAMYEGARTSLVVDDTLYVDLKQQGADKVVVALNGAENADSVTISADDVGGTTLVDLFSGAQISASGGSFTIDLESLGSRLFEVQ